MRTLQEKYNGIQEGKFSKDQFLVEARQQLPNLVTRYNGYDDAVQILKNRGMIQEAKKETVKEDYSRVLGLQDGNYFAIDGDWEDMYQGNNGLFFTIRGNSIYDKDGESIQASPREFLSQFKPDQIVQVEDIGENSQSGHFPSLIGAHKTPEEREAESRHIDDFIKRTGDKEQAEYEKRREERLKAQDERLSAYIASQRDLKETEGQEANAGSLEAGDVFRNTNSQVMLKVNHNYEITFADQYKIEFKDQDYPKQTGRVTLDKFNELVEKGDIIVFPKKNTSFSKELKEAKQPKPTKKGLADYRYKPTNEMDKYPYEQILRGLRVELETLGVKDIPTADEYTKALSKVSKNLEKDTIYYTNQVAGVNPKVDLHDKLVDATAKNTVDTFNGMKKAALKEGFKKLIKKMLSETVGDDPESILDESDPLHDYMKSKQQEDKVEDEAPGEKTITIKQLIAIANRAGDTVIDAKDDLMDLGAAYGDAIPMSRVKEVLTQYDLTPQDLKSKTVKENLDPDLEDLYDKDKERAERGMEAGYQTPNNEESSLEEGPAKNNPKIQKLVDGINQLISQAVDSDGDPIGVIEPGTTWEEPIVYSPIRYVNGALKITTNSGYRGESETYTVLARDMEYDGIPTLRLIMRMYKKAVKKAGQQAYPEKDEVDEGYDEDKIAKYEQYTYTLDGKVVEPEIAFFNNYIGAELDGQVYRVGIPDETGTVELRSHKGKTGMYTEDIFESASLKDIL